MDQPLRDAVTCFLKKRQVVEARVSETVRKILCAPPGSEGGPGFPGRGSGQRKRWVWGTLALHYSPFSALILIHELPTQKTNF